jgi:hypothetical protein
MPCSVVWGGPRRRLAADDQRRGIRGQGSGIRRFPASSCLDRIGFDERDVDFAADGGCAESGSEKVESRRKEGSGTIRAVGHGVGGEGN